MGGLLLIRNGPEPSTILTEDGIGNAWKNKNRKFSKKDSRSTCDLREDTDFAPYNWACDCSFHCFRHFRSETKSDQRSRRREKECLEKDSLHVLESMR